jgi:hypothetical protein
MDNEFFRIVIPYRLPSRSVTSSSHSLVSPFATASLCTVHSSQDTVTKAIN